MSKMNKPAAVSRNRRIDLYTLVLFLSVCLCGTLPPAFAQTQISNQNVTADEDFSDAVSILIGPDVNVESGVAVSFNSPLVAYAGPVSVERGATVVVTSMTVSGVSNEDEIAGRIPLDFSVEQNFPNPFSTTTQINYVLPDAGNVEIEVFNLLGQRNSTLYSGAQGAGEYSVVWDGRVDSGSKAPGGVYHYQVIVNDRKISRQMVLLR